jgi:hypothetical protein
MLIAVDFDGTLVSGDKAIPGAKEAINTLREQGHKIMIFSCNNTDWIKKVLADNDIRYDYIWPEAKPVYDLLIDDRNIEFNGDWMVALGKAQNGRSRWSTEYHG